tara:strand:+ start:1348 stop:2196 length:849 start_codon:yes stop_codon:yes gene_type:complete
MGKNTYNLSIQDDYYITVGLSSDILTTFYEYAQIRICDSSVILGNNCEKRMLPLREGLNKNKIYIIEIFIRDYSRPHAIVGFACFNIIWKENNLNPLIISQIISKCSHYTIKYLGNNCHTNRVPVFNYQLINNNNKSSCLPYECHPKSACMPPKNECGIHPCPPIGGCKILKFCFVNWAQQCLYLKLVDGNNSICDSIKLECKCEGCLSIPENTFKPKICICSNENKITYEMRDLIDKGNLINIPAIFEKIDLASKISIANKVIELECDTIKYLLYCDLSCY